MSTMEGVGDVIDVRRLSFGYGSTILFNHLSFTAEPGKTMVVLGPNGSGKSTLFGCLLGLIRPTSGSIRIDSKRVRYESSPLVGYVPQSAPVAFPYSVLLMVLMGRARYVDVFSTPSDKDVFLALSALKQVGIEHLAHRAYDRLSGGEKQLVLLARALASGATTLLLDEPLAALDYKNQHLLLSLLRQLSATQRLTIMLSTHNPEHAYYLATTVLLLSGKKTLFGSAQEVLTEAHLRELYGVPVWVTDLKRGKRTITSVVPELYA